MEQSKRRWSACTVKEVEETKTICRIPVCLAFIMLGVVASLEDTYFQEQASTMNNKVGSYGVPLVVLQLWYKFSKATLGKLYLKTVKRLSSHGDNNMNNNINSTNTNKLVMISSSYAGCAGIAISMIFTVLCCSVAAIVEKNRLDDFDRKGIDAITEKVGMSMFWLLPQYLLLGASVGIVEKSVGLLFHDQIPTCSDRFMPLFCSGISGLGALANVLSVFAASKISESRDDGTSWFGDTLNDSRIDSYYWLLTALSSANLVYFTILYYCTNLRSELRESDQTMDHMEPAS
ncbi:LOW QUALITY PROTEIN: Proton-dependent oligopeptide transporter family [Trema orientale]|uniref:Proton-dependent oligopeptide transporter family n=1 Tax=Trema orientale TaxID=63057 RepID=A0A2P5F4A7_TREOI|nr:LOW QUALITY PROTEIN: Proton-dependent oligopeptide transporter family [Trema orientale]